MLTTEPYEENKSIVEIKARDSRVDLKPRLETTRTNISSLEKRHGIEI